MIAPPSGMASAEFRQRFSKTKYPDATSGQGCPSSLRGDCLRQISRSTWRAIALPAEPRASRDRFLYFAYDGLSVLGFDLALEQPQAAADRSVRHRDRAIAAMLDLMNP